MWLANYSCPPLLTTSLTWEEKVERTISLQNIKKVNIEVHTPSFLGCNGY